MFARRLSISLALVMVVTAADTAAQTVYVIQHAKVVTVSGPTIPDGSVVIKDGRIAEVGAAVTIPSGARIIEARGLTVCPGLFDPSSGLGLGEAVVESNLGQFVPELRPSTSLVSESEAIPVARSAGVTHILLRMGRNVIPSQAELLNLAGWTGEEMLVQRRVAMPVAFPTVGEVQYTEDERFQVTSWSTLKTQYEQRLKQLKDFFASARAYMKASEQGAGAGARNQRLEAMIPVLRRQEVVILETQNHVDIRNAVEFAKEEGLDYVVAAPVGAWRIPDFLKANGVRVLIGTTQAYPDGEDDAYDSVYRTAAVLHEKGVPFAFSTLANRQASVRLFPQAVGKAVAFGLPPDVALRAATLNAAEFFSVADKVGSIEQGKIANLVVVAGDIFDTQSSIKHVFINGEPVSLRTRETDLYDEFRARPAPKKTDK